MEPLDGARSNFGEYQIPSPDSPVESAHGNVHFPWISSQFAQAQGIPRIPFVATLERQSSAIPRSIQIPIFKIIQVFIPSGRSWQELQFQAGREIRELHPQKKKKKNSLLRRLAPKSAEEAPGAFPERIPSIPGRVIPVLPEPGITPGASFGVQIIPELQIPGFCISKGEVELRRRWIRRVIPALFRLFQSSRMSGNISLIFGSPAVCG